MKIRIYNATRLTMETVNDMNKPDCYKNFRLVPPFHGEIHIENDKITRIISLHSDSVSENETSNGFDRQIDAKMNVVMPGFKNAHAHSPMTFARSYADDLPLSLWLNEKIFPMEAKLTPDDIRVFTKIAIMEYLSSGITAAFDMYFKPENIASAAISCGFRSVLCGAVNDFTESVQRMNDFYEYYNSKDDSLVTFNLGFHAEYTTSEDILKEIAMLAKDKKAPVYCHNSETKAEVAACVARHGTTPVCYLDSLSMFDYGGGGFHLVYTTDEDMKILKSRKLHVITNPGSNAKLASGVAPLYKYMDAGLNIAIGTDGPASNNALDMFREMYLVTALSKLLTQNAASMDAEMVLYMASAGGAKAMGLNDCDVLAPGKKADLIIIDLNKPNMQPVNNITKNIVYSGSKENVIMTMINGRILYENNEFFIGDSKETIFAKANEMVKLLHNQ